MKSAICPGSFDPITLGHLDIIERSSKIFDKLIVVVMLNCNNKGQTSISAEDRAELIRKSIAHLNNVEVDIYNGLLSEYARLKGVTTVVKGLRYISDFEYEFQKTLTYKNIDNNFETVFMISDKDSMLSSSSTVRKVCELGGDISPFVPKAVHDDIVKLFSKQEA